MHRVLMAIAPLASWFAGLSLWILDRICPAIQAGSTLPFGLSRGKESTLQTDIVRLLLPVFVWKGEDYIASRDEFRRGWWMRTVMLGVLRTPGGFDIRVRTGNWPRGYGAIQAFDTGEWLDEWELRNEGRRVVVNG